MKAAEEVERRVLCLYTGERQLGSSTSLSLAPALTARSPRRNRSSRRAPGLYTGQLSPSTLPRGRQESCFRAARNTQRHKSFARALRTLRTLATMSQASDSILPDSDTAGEAAAKEGAPTGLALEGRRGARRAPVAPPRLAVFARLFKNASAFFCCSHKHAPSLHTQQHSKSPWR